MQCRLALRSVKSRCKEDDRISGGPDLMWDFSVPVLVFGSLHLTSRGVDVDGCLCHYIGKFLGDCNLNYLRTLVIMMHVGGEAGGLVSEVVD